MPDVRLNFQDGDQVLLIDQRGKRFMFFLRKSETFHSDRGWIVHDSIIGQPEGTWVRSSMGLRHLALRPTLAEYVLELLRAVGPEGKVITYEQREEFARRALANIHTRLGEVGNLVVRLGRIEDGVQDEQAVDRVVLDLPEPWKLVDAVAARLRPGGILLSYLPTIIQSHQLT